MLHKKYGGVFATLLLTTAVFAENSANIGSIPTINLKAKQLFLLPATGAKETGQEATPNLEPSGVTVVDQHLWLISDEALDTAIYILTKNSVFPAIKFDQFVDGYSDYVENLIPEEREVTIARAKNVLENEGLKPEKIAKKIEKLRSEKLPDFDIEGIAVCQSNIYLVNERFRHVLELDRKSKTFKKLNIAFPDSAFAGTINAGFEGIAADCDHNVLYVAKERSPREIYKVNLTTLDIEKVFQTPEQETKSLIVNGKEVDVGADYADLSFSHHLLFVLERNAQRISVISPEHGNVIAYLDYSGFHETTYHDANGLYDTGEPFGIAEGLALDGKQIVLLFDNNEAAFSEKSLDTYLIDAQHRTCAAGMRFDIDPDSFKLAIRKIRKSSRADAKKLDFLAPSPKEALTLRP